MAIPISRISGLSALLTAMPQSNVLGLARLEAAQGVGQGYKEPALSYTAPTITLSAANAASAISSAVFWPAWDRVNARANTPVFGFSSCNPIQAGNVSPLRDYASSDFGSDTLSYPTTAVDFWVYDTKFEIILNGTGGRLRVNIDGSEALRCGVASNSGTAQAGANTTITLAAGASATNGNYNTQWVYITGGTGSGQSRQITGYVGATKVATVAAAWSTNPDATSTYEVRISQYSSFSWVNDGSTRNILFDYSGQNNGQPQLHRVRLEFNGFFGGVNTGPIGAVSPSVPNTYLRSIWLSDSYVGGTGGDGPMISLGGVCCAQLGWEFYNDGEGGTGYLNPNTPSDKMVIGDRAAPPYNSWKVNLGQASGGTLTFTFNGVTSAAVAFNANAKTQQAALAAMSSIGYDAAVQTSGTAQAGSTSSTIKLASADTALDGFYVGMQVLLTGGTGSGQLGYVTAYVASTKVATVATNWSVTPDSTTTYELHLANVQVYGQPGNNLNWWILFRGTLANSTNALTIGAGSLTGNPNLNLRRWTGAIAPNVPKDANGNALPFVIVIAGGYNDTSAVFASYTSAALKAAAASVWSNILANYPTATLLVLGPWAATGSPSAQLTQAQTDLAAQAAATLPLYNGVLPYHSMQGIITGTGNVGNPSGSGSADVAIFTDGIHPTQPGHELEGRFAARFLAGIMGIATLMP